MLKASSFSRWCTVIALVVALHLGVGYLSTLSGPNIPPPKKNTLVVKTIKLSPPPLIAATDTPHSAPVEKVPEPLTPIQPLQAPLPKETPPTETPPPPKNPEPAKSPIPKKTETPPPTPKKTEPTKPDHPKKAEPSTQPKKTIVPDSTTQKPSPPKTPPPSAPSKEKAKPVEKPSAAPKEKAPVPTPPKTQPLPKKTVEPKPVENLKKNDTVKQDPAPVTKKLTPDKPVSPPSPPPPPPGPTPEEIAAQKAKEEALKRKNALISDAQTKLSQLKNTPKEPSAKAQDKTELPILGSLATDATVDDFTPSTKPERDYVSELVKRLKLSLKLPEYGTVKIKLTLKRSGEIASYKIEKGSKKNTDYVDSKLPELSFPAFGQFLPDESTHTFSLSLSNEI